MSKKLVLKHTEDSVEVTLYRNEESGEVTVKVGDYSVLLLRPGVGVICYVDCDADEIGMPVDENGEVEVFSGDEM